MDDEGFRFDDEHDVMFVTSASTSEDLKQIHILIDSLRTFGGRLAHAPIWLFFNPVSIEHFPKDFDEGVMVHPLRVPQSTIDYALSSKVCACAEAERLTDDRKKSLIWLSPDTLIVHPPTEFILDDEHDAALRPVHIKNIGLAVDAKIDDFWKGVMDCAGIADIDYAVESFVDRQPLRAYFNSHSYCIKPSLGIFRRWRECFEELVGDKSYQTRSCSDDLHKIFLHQAILSALTVAMIPTDRIKILPATYSYPYNLQESIPIELRETDMGRLVSLVYEDQIIDPNKRNDIEVCEPLRSWLSSRVAKRSDDIAGE